MKLLTKKNTKSPQALSDELNKISPKLCAAPSYKDITLIFDLGEENVIEAKVVFKDGMIDIIVPHEEKLTEREKQEMLNILK